MGGPTPAPTREWFGEKVDACLRDNPPAGGPDTTVNTAEAEPYRESLSFDPLTSSQGPVERGVFSADRLRKDGFATAHGGAMSFGKAYLDIYSADLPVFITTDSILHAWHTSFNSILMTLEQAMLLPLAEDILTRMLESLHRHTESLKHVHGEVFDDVKTYLGVAVALSTGCYTPNFEVDHSTGGYPWESSPERVWWEELAPDSEEYESEFSDEESTEEEKAARARESWKAAVFREIFFLDGAATPLFERVKAILMQVNQATGLEVLPLFRDSCTPGPDLTVDYTQFSIRGHYTKSPELAKYFVVLMWLGKVTLDCGRAPQGRATLLLLQLLRLSDTFSAWSSLEEVLCLFSGESDSLNFAQLLQVYEASAPGTSLADASRSVPDSEVRRLFERVEAAGLGKPQYNGQATYEADGMPQVQFAFMGQRFVIDSWAMAQVMYDGERCKVKRRVASAVDVAYSTFGNDLAGRIAEERMQRGPGSGLHEPWLHRDGFAYARNLNATRQTVDAVDGKFWTSSVYNNWLAAIRTLSSPTTDPEIYPEAMQTEAWSRKDLNTQLGSWAQLRHDTVLMSKAPEPAICGCDNPHGYVEPRVDFFRTMNLLASNTALRLAKVVNSGVPQDDKWAHAFNPQQVLGFLGAFAEVMTSLMVMAMKECNHEALNAAESMWVRQAVESAPGASGWGSQSGWYYGLFYDGCFGNYALDADNIVVDVMTDTPDELDPGGVLHVGLCDVDLMCVCVDGAGASKDTSLPGKGVDFMARLRALNASCFEEEDEEAKKKCPPRVATNPDHSRAERVPGFENAPLPYPVLPGVEGASGAVPAAATGTELVKPTFFYGPLFRYFEFLAPYGTRLSDNIWEAGVGCEGWKECGNLKRVHRPEMDQWRVTRPEWLYGRSMTDVAEGEHHGGLFNDTFCVGLAHKVSEPPTEKE